MSPSLSLMAEEKLASPRMEIFPDTVLMATLLSKVMPCLQALPLEVASYPYPFMVIAPEVVDIETDPLFPFIFIPKPMVNLPFTSPIISMEPAAVVMVELSILTP